MLLTLLRMRLSSLFSTMFAGKKKTRGTVLTVLAALLFLFAIAYFAVILGALFFIMGAPLFEAGAAHAYFGLGALAMLVLMLAGSVIYTKSQLFAANDNELLLSMPIPPHLILLSRILVLLLLNFILEGLIALPLLLVWLLIGTPTVAGIFSLLLVLLILPPFALTLSTGLAYLITRIGRRIRKKNIVVLLLSLLLMLGYFLFVSVLDGMLESLEADITPLISFVDAVLPIAAIGRAMLGSPVELLLTVLPLLLIILLAFRYFSRSYLKTALDTRGERHAVYRARTVRARSPLRALTVRELTHLTSSPGYMMNTGTGLIMMLIPPVLLLINREPIGALAAELPMLGACLPALAASVNMAISSMIYFSAVTVSLEGRALWIVRSSPIPTRTVLLSKLLFHLVLTAPVATVSSVLYAIALRASIPEAILILLVSLAFLLASAVLGLLFNLFFPKLEWKNEMIPIKQGISGLLSMLGGIAVSAVVGGIAALLSLVLSASLALLAALLLLAAVSAGLLALLLHTGARRFEAL